MYADAAARLGDGYILCKANDGPLADDDPPCS